MGWEQEDEAISKRQIIALLIIRIINLILASGNWTRDNSLSSILFLSSYTFCKQSTQQAMQHLILKEKNVTEYVSFLLPYFKGPEYGNKKWFHRMCQKIYTYKSQLPYFFSQKLKADTCF